MQKHGNQDAIPGARLAEGSRGSKMAKYKITNSFHRTETTTKYSPEYRAQIQNNRWCATKAQLAAMRRAKRALCCPDSGCTCSDSWGER